MCDVMRKLAFCIRKKKQRSRSAVHWKLCPKFQDSQLSSDAAQAGLCLTWSETLDRFCLDKAFRSRCCIDGDVWFEGAIRKMSLVIRKPDFCICENKDADQLRGKSEADQRLCFRYIERTIPLLSKSEISSL